ncbi:hypothetical protein BJ322DRAFT_1010829 [Thelephora terrestris]|uniref:AAA+ ATPase domain-containing protein n=1 Tax=Thelephora terrestris TaxID=56493 RepID=A0A9P6H8I7_9AGAM|nr:hypothetical protein BJ322DRAFT_1010829 [Thelephora terrestris]
MRRSSTTASSSRQKTARPSLESPTLRPSTSSRSRAHREGFSYHWIFRSNIPKRRSLLLTNDIQKRNFFGMGEVFGVLVNPGQTLRSLTEAKSLLEQTRNELTEAKERAQIRPTHTFSPLPPTIFFPRPTEVKAIENALMGQPSWTVVFGASSTGKTAILRHVLSNPRYHVLHFDLRIAGFAGLAGLHTSLCQQMEQYFAMISETMEGYGDFEVEALAFKHERLNIERRLAGTPQEDGASAPGGSVNTTDVARLMEMFQSSLLKYRDFEPFDDEDQHSDLTHIEEHASQRNQNHTRSKSFWKRVRSQRRPKSSNKGKEREFTPSQDQSMGSNTPRRQFSHKGKEDRPEKRVPVIFFDEAHKLPALIHSTGAMKCLLDAMLVLTKQDRLCHVIHATSEPFYQTWLRKANVMQHCKILTIGDCTKSETRAFFRDRVIPEVPDKLRMGLSFEHLWDAFGGKLAHWQDYITDYVNANGKLDIKQSSHFLQAHALLNLHIIHSSECPPESPDTRRNQQVNSGSNGRATPSGPGFRVYSPLTAGVAEEDDHDTADFTASQLIKVMVKLTESEDGPARALPYFLLCKEIGVKAVDGMVRGRMLDLRWTDVVRRSNTFGLDDRTNPNSQRFQLRGRLDTEGDHSQTQSNHSRQSGELSHSHTRAESAATMINPQEAIYDAEEGEIVPALSDAGDTPVTGPGEQRYQPMYHQEEVEEDYGDDGFVGPKLFPATPIMRYAMKVVVSDYIVDEDTASEYASLSDVNEY